MKPESMKNLNVGLCLRFITVLPYEFSAKGLTNIFGVLMYEKKIGDIDNKFYLKGEVMRKCEGATLKTMIGYDYSSKNIQHTAEASYILDKAQKMFKTGHQWKISDETSL